MRRLAEIDRGKLAEALGERLVFEKRSVLLYERAIARFRSMEPAIRRIVPRLEQHRDDERAHADWLTMQLQRLESPPPAPSRLMELEWASFEGVFADENAGARQLLSVLLLAERDDHFAWELLVRVAERAGDLAAQKELSLRHEQERLHVAYLERVLVECTCNHVLGVPVTLPIDP
jgi:hypothetical protein